VLEIVRLGVRDGVAGRDVVLDAEVALAALIRGAVMGTKEASRPARVALALVNGLDACDFGAIVAVPCPAGENAPFVDARIDDDYRLFVAGSLLPFRKAGNALEAVRVARVAGSEGRVSGRCGNDRGSGCEKGDDD